MTTGVLYDIGDVVNVFVTFTDADGDEGDPTTVTLVIRKPSGELATVDTFATHVADSGYYEYPIEIDAAGWWYVEWRGTGAIAAVEPVEFRVRRSRVGDPGSFTPEP